MKLQVAVDKLFSHKLFSNKYFLYAVVAASVLSNYMHIVASHYEVVGFFILVGIIMMNFSKNIAVVLTVCLLLTQIIMAGKAVQEGLENRKMPKEVSKTLPYINNPDNHFPGIAGGWAVWLENNQGDDTNKELYSQATRLESLYKYLNDTWNDPNIKKLKPNINRQKLTERYTKGYSSEAGVGANVALVALVNKIKEKKAEKNQAKKAAAAAAAPAAVTATAAAAATGDDSVDEIKKKMNNIVSKLREKYNNRDNNVKKGDLHFMKVLKGKTLPPEDKNKVDRYFRLKSRLPQGEKQTQQTQQQQTEIKAITNRRRYIRNQIPGKQTFALLNDNGSEMEDENGFDFMGPSDLSGLTQGTTNLMTKQKDLFSLMNSFGPLVDNAKKILNID
jgi:hypothetical protein